MRLHDLKADPDVATSSRAVWSEELSRNRRKARNRPEAASVEKAFVGHGGGVDQLFGRRRARTLGLDRPHDVLKGRQCSEPAGRSVSLSTRRPCARNRGQCGVPRALASWCPIVFWRGSPHLAAPRLLCWIDYSPLGRLGDPPQRGGRIKRKHPRDLD
jgi:hypothetical protein